MKGKVLFCFYREWGVKAADKLIDSLSTTYQIYTARHTEELTALCNSVKFDLIFFLGWSWIIDKPLLESSLCICMHPSPLPKYKGGSPIQNQIINGETESAVTFFKMTEKIDAGPIILSSPLSLQGNLSDIFNRIQDSCVEHIPRIIDNFFKKTLSLKPQDSAKATYFKRRTPAQSEIKIEDFNEFPASYFYNKTRMLQDPYPNAYIKCKDGTKFFITHAYGLNNIPSC
jgi:methionyl-tRNA formyltransferase